MAGHVHAIAQGIGAQQRGMGIVPKNIHKRACVDGIDMLRVERQASPCEPVGNAPIRMAAIAVSRASA